jgi:glutaredoxin-related protein
MRFLAQQMAFTVPQVFVGDRRVGGYEATMEAILAGEFARLLEAEQGAGGITQRAS